MSDLADFTRRIPAFDRKGFTAKIETFAWFLQEISAKPKFSPADIVKCFELSHSAKPSSVHTLLRNLCEKKPARLLKDSQGYRLTAAVREQLGKSLGQRASSGATTALLAGLIPNVTNTAQRTFLNETLICFNNKAFRSAIVMAWNLIFSHVCDRIFETHAAVFNEQRQKVYPKLPELTKRTDFEDYKESQVIEICRGARILDATVCKTLTEKLGRRNTAAHPSSNVITEVSAEDMIVDLVTNVLLNPAI
ncbi:hypothetical protein [Collimonas fungivorans]|uniref:hypothetical protein n=1 Tax=Collimonas fungivorans TaxID=158899 RepID=UPI0005A18E48|nr:hypothetical protein [Collimonas fungivorans]